MATFDRYIHYKSDHMTFRLTFSMKEIKEHSHSKEELIEFVSTEFRKAVIAHYEEL